MLQLEQLCAVNIVNEKQSIDIIDKLQQVCCILYN